MSSNQSIPPFVSLPSRQNRQSPVENRPLGLGTWLSMRRLPHYPFMNPKAHYELGSSLSSGTLGRHPSAISESRIAGRRSGRHSMINRPSTPNPKLEATKPYDGPPLINRLPAELLLHIFEYDDPGIKHRVKTTHICRKWRTIAIETGSLWTTVEIAPGMMDSNKAFHNFLSLLDMQLDRTLEAPLDVTWHIREEGSRTLVVIDLLHRKGPFHRWRTLALYIHTRAHGELLPADAFPNLQSLLVQPVHDHPILRAINLTTTSRLKLLEIRHWGTRPLEIEHHYGAMLKRIKRLVISDADYNVILPSLPVNIVDIEAGRRNIHLFPHIKTYKLAYGVFRPNHTISLRNLTTLVVTGSLDVEEHCKVVLPSLRHLVFANVSLANKSILDAPLLETLKLRSDPKSSPDETRKQISNVRTVLRHPGYLLAPTKTLSLEMCLATDLTLVITERSPSLEKLELTFNHSLNESIVTAMIAETKQGNEIFCPQLTELRLSFHKNNRKGQNVTWWEKWATQVVKGRRGFAVVPRIYAALDGEGAITRLA